MLLPPAKERSIGGDGVVPPHGKCPWRQAGTTKLGKIRRPQMGRIQRPLTRPPLAQLERRTYMSDSISLGSGRHHFFATRSFKAELSSIASAKSFFSLAFSLSSPLKRLASFHSL